MSVDAGGQCGKMGYTVESGDFETRVDLACGGKIYFNLRGGRTSPQREVPQVRILYEGAPPERDMDYMEMSVFMLDDRPMIGGVPVDCADSPELHFLNLSQDLNRAITSAVQVAFNEFRERNRKRLIELAQSTLHGDSRAAGEPAQQATMVADAPQAKRRGRRKVDHKAESQQSSFRLPLGFFASEGH